MYQVSAANGGRSELFVCCKPELGGDPRPTLEHVRVWDQRALAAFSGVSNWPGLSDSSRCRSDVRRSTLCGIARQNCLSFPALARAKKDRDRERNKTAQRPERPRADK